MRKNFVDDLHTLSGEWPNGQNETSFEKKKEVFLMKHTTGKVLSLLLTLVMLLSLLPTVALAAPETEEPKVEITTDKGTETVIGNTKIQSAIQLAAYKSPAEKVKVNVLSGDLDIWGIPCGVTITNSGTGNVIINGKIGVTVPSGQTVTLTHVKGWKNSYPANCEREGVQDYYKCRACNKLFEDEAMTVEIENLWQWKNDPAHILPLAPHTPEVVSEPATCTKTGVKDYYHCTYCDKNFEDEACTKEITDLEAWKAENVLPMVPHTYRHMISTPPCCFSEGIQSYYQCKVCNKFFEDKELTIEIENIYEWKHDPAHILPMTPHTLEKISEPATCTTTGVKDYYRCTLCKDLFEDEAGTKKITDLEAWKAENVLPMLPHTPDEHGWYSDEDGHFHQCGVCGAIFDEQEHTFEMVIDKAPTTTTEGSGHQHCTICGYDGPAVVLPVHTHKVVLVPGKDATTTDTGLKPYYFCEGCNKNFEDEACTKEITGDLDAWRVIPVKTPDKPDSNTPATGDSTSVALYAGLMVAAVMGLGVVAVYKRKDRQA